MLHRRELLKATGAAMLSVAATPLLKSGNLIKEKLIVFTRSAGFQHDVVKLDKNGTCLVHEVLKEIGPKHGYEVECTKDGRIFTPGTFDKFDAFFFYTTEDLTAENSK